MFKNENDFKKLISRLNIDSKPDPTHRHNLRRQMLSAFSEPRQKTLLRAETWQVIGRSIMKSQVSKLATAAAIILIAALGITLLDKSATPAWAIEQSIEAMEQYRAVLIEGLQSERTWRENGSLDLRPYRSWAVANEDQTMVEKYRTEVDGVLILTTNGQKTWRYDPNANTVYVENRPYVASDCWCGSRFLEQLKGFHDSGLLTRWEETYGKDPATGRQRVSLTIAWLKGRYNGPRSLWLEFDKESKLLVSLKQWENADREGPATLVGEKFTYYQNLPDNLFEFEIPEDATVIRE